MSDLRRMVPELIQKAREEKIQRDEPDLNEFETVLATYKFFLKPSRKGISLTLFNWDGRPIETYDEEVEDPFGNPMDVPLPSLFNLAKRRARRVDESLAEVEGLLRRL